MKFLILNFWVERKLHGELDRIGVTNFWNFSTERIAGIYKLPKHESVGQRFDFPQTFTRSDKRISVVVLKFF